MNKTPKLLLTGLIVVMIISACTSPTTEQGEQLTQFTPAATFTPPPSPSATPTPTPPPEERVHEGDTALFAGDYDAALEIFSLTAAQSSDPAVVSKSHLGIGQAYYYLQNYGPALNNLRMAVSAEDPIIAARAHYMMGKTFTQLQRYDEALTAYEAYLSLRAGLIDSHVHELRGDLFRTTGNNNQAINSYQEAYRTDPGGGTESLAVKIARAYQNDGDTQTALSLYKDIYNSSNNDYTKATMDLLIGQIYLSRDEPEQAYTYFQDAVNNFPFAYDAYTALVTLVNDGVPVNEYQRGLVNYYVRNYTLAIEAFDRYMAEAPEAFGDGALHFKALSTRALGNRDDPSPYNTAIALWEQLIREYPTSQYYTNAWQGIEFTYWAYLADPESAAQTALDFVAQRPAAPEAPDFLFLAGRSYERAGLLTEASSTWARIANEYPDSDETFRAVYFAGIALVRLGDWAGAQPLFSRALVLSSEPKDIAAAYLWIGKCQEAQGDISAALDSWKQAQIANPFGHYSIRAEDLLMDREPFAEPDSYLLDSDLTAYRQEAETWLRETFSLPPDTNLESPGLFANDARFQRGLEFWALGQYQAAKSEFESIRVEFAQDPAQTFRLIPALIDIGLYRSALTASTQLLRLAGLEGGDALQAPEYFSRIRFGAYYLDWLLPAAEAEGLSPLLILSVIRQESAYEGFATSVADARGLMQILRTTGDDLYNRLGWPEDYTVEDLYRPNVSLVFGTSYLRQWQQYFEGDVFAMLASYNGGIGNTIFWMDLNPSGDPDLFLEIIRLEETRNYIRIINEIHYIYRWLYGSPMTP